MKINFRGIYYHYWSNWVTRPVHEMIFAHFRERFSYDEGAQVLDLGCGTGFYEKVFKAANYRGVDLSNDCVEYGQRQGLDLYCADVTKTPFESLSFDFLFCANVVHHLDDATIKGMLSEAKRLLREGGQFVLYDIYRKEGQSLILRLAHQLDFGAYVRELPQIEKLFEKDQMFEKKIFSQFGIYDYYCMHFVKK